MRMIDFNIPECDSHCHCIEEDAVCLGGTRSNMQHTYLLSEVQGKIWMPLIVNVKLKSADSDQVSRSKSA